MPDMPLIIIFESVHETLKMEDLLETEDIAYQSIVKPRILGVDCGVAISFDKKDLDVIRKLAQTNHLVVKGVYHRENNTWEPYS